MPDWGSDLRRRLGAEAHQPELIDELSQYLDDFHADLLSRGVDPGEAERLTRLELDRAARLPRRLVTRPLDRRRWTTRAMAFVAGAAQDARFALRLFRRRAGVMSLALGGLAAAIALATVIFSALNAIALRPMGVADPEQVVHVERIGDGNVHGWTLERFARLRAATTRLTPEAWWVQMAPSSPDFQSGWHESVPMHFVGATFLETFGGQVAHGRLLVPDDRAPSAPVRAVVSHAFWARRLGADAAIAGRTLTIGQTPVTIVGIAASSFSGPSSHWDAPAAFWVPIEKREAFDTIPSALPSHLRPVSVVARLREAESLAAAQAEAASIAAADATGAAPRVFLRRLDPPFDDDDLLGIGLTLGLVALLLLQAYANVANLLLANATVRRPEIGARLALGASRGRLTRQLLTEALLLGAAAGVTGVLIAAWIGPALTHIAWIPPSVDLSPDWRVLLFAAVISAGAALVCGFVAGRHAIVPDVSQALKSSTPIGGRRTSSRLRHGFIGLQAATSILLLVVASLFTRALLRTTVGDLGLDVGRLVSISLASSIKDDALQATLRATALERVRAIDGVEVAATASSIPLADGGLETLWLPGSRTAAAVRSQVSPEYFATVGVTLRRGRLLTADDVRQRAPVAVVSSALVERYFTGEDAIGASLQRVHPTLGSVSIVGIAADMITTVRQTGPAAIVYTPLTDAGAARHIVIRARSDAATLTVPLQSALEGLHPELSVRVRTLRESLDRAMGPVGMIASVATILAVFTLTLAALGLAGVTTFAVQQRQREIGVRLALGASRDRVLKLLVRQALTPVAIGLAAGLAAAMSASGFISNVLYGIGPRDPLAVAGAVVVLVVAALVAVIVPSGRATRLDPARVLRE